MLIIAKTYPELSAKYGETVCTAAVDETGNPLRLYPIPFRYLAGTKQVLDSEICELARKRGLDAARTKVQLLLDSDRHRTAFFLGNFHMYPASFAIIGLWYPLRSDGLF